jgi:hypothetical protein
VSPKKNVQQLSWLPRFGSGFLVDHARLIISDPKIAIVELVANAWDAGADQVEITWPISTPGRIAIKDNGLGMTRDEFVLRWRELSYNRREAQGEEVDFPIGNKTSYRKAFGRNGKGRHSMFCFNDKYYVKTWRDGQCNTFSVERSTGESPFKFDLLNTEDLDGHGTEIFTELHRHDLRLRAVRELIGSKFIADPAFKLFVNDELVVFTELEHLIETRVIEIADFGRITIRVIDSQKTGRTSKQHGVAWWVYTRLVGEPSWKGFDDDAFLDARSAEAKRYTFIVEAEMLTPADVQDDWSSFRPTDNVGRVQSEVKKHVFDLLRDVMGDVHKSRKVTALTENINNLKGLSSASLNFVGQVVDDVQGKYPSFGERELNATVAVIANLEKARSGFSLLEQLARLGPNDLDQLNEILGKWSVQEAGIVLGELEKRLKLIENLDRLVENPSTDELHELQPLFERGLWIFGPEFESIEFTSNSSLTTVLKNLLEDKVVRPLSNPRKRPDFVVLPDSTLGVYSRDSFDERSEPDGIDKVLIVELKRGGFPISHKEVSQAEGYIRELRKGQRVQKTSSFIAFVLGATLTEDAEEKVIGENRHSIITPRTYSTVLRMAHARTFSLLRAIKAIRKDVLSDPEVGQVLGVPTPDAFISK